MGNVPGKFAKRDRGIAAVRGIEGLTNPRGFIIVDKHQRNPKFPNVFGVGVCIATALVLLSGWALSG